MSTHFMQYARSYDVRNDKCMAYYRIPLTLIQNIHRAEVLINVNKWIPIVNHSDIILIDKEHNTKEIIAFGRGLSSNIYYAVWKYINRVYAKRLIIALEANVSRVKKSQDLTITYPFYCTIKEDVIELYDTINSYYEVYGYEKPFGVQLPTDPDVIKEIYRAFSLTEGMISPNGDVDSEYLVNNLPYLLHAYNEEEEWEYRIYVPFAGIADVRATPQWHCMASHRFNEILEQEEETSDNQIVRPRARRYA